MRTVFESPVVKATFVPASCRPARFIFARLGLVVVVALATTTGLSLRHRLIISARPWSLSALESLMGKTPMPPGASFRPLTSARTQARLAPSFGQNLTIQQVEGAVSHSTTTLGSLPLYFEPNQGQTDARVKFLVRGGGVTTFLTATEAVFALPTADQPFPNEGLEEEHARSNLSFGLHAFDRDWLKPSRSTPNPRLPIANRPSVVTMKLVGANPNAKVEGLDRLPGISNYFVGNDPAKWRTNIPHYAKIRYHPNYAPNQPFGLVLGA